MEADAVAPTRLEAYQGAKYRTGATIANNHLDDGVAPIYLEGLSTLDCPVDTITVLYVDDDDFQRESIRSLFELANKESALYQLHAFSSASEALAAFAPPTNLRPDLILLDIMMPGDMQGDALLVQIRQLATAMDMKMPKFVMASILSHVKRVNDLLAIGADGYLVKPVAPITIKLIWQFVHPGHARDQANNMSMDTSAVEPSASSIEPSPRATLDHWAGGPARPPTQPSGAPAAPASLSSHGGHVYSRLRGANPAGRLRPIRLRPEDEEAADIGGCKQQ